MKKRTAGRKCIELLLVCVLCLNRAPMEVRSADKDVYLVKAEGNVSQENAAGRALKHFNNMKLQNGSRIKTGRDGRALLSVGENGELILENCGEAELRISKSMPEFLMDRGAASFDLTESNISLNIRTSIAAMTIENAEGRIYVQDRQHTLICLEEGELRCSVADPISGQVKTARLTGRRTAECVIYPEGENGKYCDILLRETREEDRNRNTVCNGEEQQLEFSTLRDPVWEDGLALADASKTEEPISREDDSDEQDSSEDQGTKYYPGIYLPPSMPLPRVPLGWDNALTESQNPASSGSDHGSGSQSGSSSSSASDSESGVVRPGTESPAPSESETTPSVPTEDRGLVLNVAKNNGTIEVNNGGKLVIQNEDKELLNEGDIRIWNQGIIEGEIVNDAEDANFVIEVAENGMDKSNGKVTRVSNTANGGIIDLRGGTVEEGIKIEGGTLEINNAAIKASEPLKTLEVVALTRRSRTLPTIIYHQSGESESRWEETDGKGLLYITEKSTDGLVELCGLRDEFPGVVEDLNNRGGDTITLTGDVTDATAEKTETIDVKSGTKKKPVVFDLNGNTLRMIYNYQDENRYSQGFINFNNSVWEIKNGTMIVEDNNPRWPWIRNGIHINNASEVTLSKVDLTGDLYNYNNSKLAVSGSKDEKATVTGFIINCYKSDFRMTDVNVDAGTNTEIRICNYYGGQFSMERSNANLGIGGIHNGWSNGVSSFKPIVTSEMEGYKKLPNNMTISGTDQGISRIENQGIMSVKDSSGIADLANYSVLTLSNSEVGYLDDAPDPLTEISDGSKIEHLIGNQGKTMKISKSTVGDIIIAFATSSDRLDKLEISESTVGDIDNMGCKSMDINNSTVGNIVNYPHDDSGAGLDTVLKVSDSTIMLGGYQAEQLSLRASSKAGIQNSSTSVCEINNSTIELQSGGTGDGDDGGDGDDASNDRSVILNEGTMRLNNCKIEKSGVPIKNSGEILLSGCKDMEGEIYNSDTGNCTLQDCSMSVTGNGIMTEQGTLLIEGGNYTREVGNSPSSGFSIISINPNREGTSKVYIDSGAVLTTSNGAVPVYIGSKGIYCYSFDITIGNAVIDGGTLPALIGNLESANGNPNTAVTIGQNARLTSETTVASSVLYFNWPDNVNRPNLQLNFEGGSITNTGNGSALGFRLFDDEAALLRNVSIEGEIAGNLRTKGIEPIIMYYKSQNEKFPYIPDGYAIEDDGEYCYLVKTLANRIKVQAPPTPSAVLGETLLIPATPSDIPEEIPSAPVTPSNAFEAGEGIKEDAGFPDDSGGKDESKTKEESEAKEEDGSKEEVGS